jgi:hypothetical protein
VKYRMEELSLEKGKGKEEEDIMRLRRTFRD